MSTIPEILEAFIKVAPFLIELHVDDLSIAITDLEKYVCYVPGKGIKFPVKPGDILNSSTAIYQAMKENRRLTRQMGSEVFGFPYIAVAIPVTEKGKVVGGVCFLQSIEKQDRLFTMADSIFKEITHLNASTQEIAAASESLTSVGVDLSQLTKSVLDQTKKSQDITNIVKRISNQTNLLGLNASIEAARLGEEGRGFNVVAEEIRKLAVSTKESIEKIEGIVNGLQKTSGNMSEEVFKIEKAAYQQGNSIYEITESTQNLYNLIERLRAEAEELSK